MNRTRRSYSDTTNIQRLTVRYEGMRMSASYGSANTGETNDQVFVSEHKFESESVQQRKSGILRSASFIRKKNVEPIIDDESYINAVIADIVEEDSPQPKRHSSMSFLTRKSTREMSNDTSSAWEVIKRNFIAKNCISENEPQPSQRHFSMSAVTQKKALHSSGQSRWQNIKRNFAKAAGSIDNLSRKAHDVSGVSDTLQSKMSSKETMSSAELEMVTEEKERKRNKSLKRKPSLKFLPFCEKYDGFSCRKTKTISESIQAILEQKEQEKNARLRNLVEEKVAELLTPTPLRSKFKAVSLDSQSHSDKEDQCKDMVKDRSENDQLYNQSNSSDTNSHSKHLVDLQNKRDSSKYSSSESSLYEDNDLREMVDRHVLHFFESYFKGFDCNSNGVVLLDDFNNSQNCDNFGIMANFTMNNKPIVDVSNVSIKHTTSEDSCVNQSNTNEVCYLQKPDKSSNMNQLKQMCCKTDRSCKLYITIYNAFSENKLKIEIDRIKSLISLPFAKGDTKTMIKACFMPRNGSKEKKTRCAKGGDVVTFQDTLVFDKSPVDAIENYSIRFKIYQKRSSLIGSKFVCVGESVVWLDECGDLRGKSQIVAKIHPYL